MQMKETNFDRYLDKQTRDPEFAARFKRAGDAWDNALQIAAPHARVRVVFETLDAVLSTATLAFVRPRVYFSKRIRKKHDCDTAKNDTARSPR